MLHDLSMRSAVENALKEDLGHGFDRTSALLSPDQKSEAIIRLREDAVLCGTRFAYHAMTLCDPSLSLTIVCEDGDFCSKGQDVVKIYGSMRSILTAERVALNFLSHLSGIATETHLYVESVKGTRAKICCTRKTLPGLRSAQKYAVKTGGGENHRFGLDDAILIKDNHIAVMGGVRQAIAAARDNAGHMIKIEIEVDTLAQLEEVMRDPVDVVLLDNMAPETLRKAVALIDGKCVSEASGGVNLDTVRAIAETGVDLISIGALTHSVRAIDFGLDIESV